MDGEDEVLRRVREGDRQAICELISCHKARIFGLLVRQTGDRILAQDLTQETFLRAVKGIRKFRGDAGIATWLTRIALNVSHSYFASRAYRNQHQTEALLIPIHDTSADNESARLEYENAAFRAALAELKPIYREVVVLCALEGQTYEEAAATLGTPIGTVRSRLHQARTLLRSALAKRFEYVQA